MNDGGPAFPAWKPVLDGVCPLHEGMSLRDYFAAMAMQGFVASNAKFVNVPNTTEEHYAIASYSVADFMLREREKQK